jgi:hypothetical protein
MATEKSAQEAILGAVESLAAKAASAQATQSTVALKFATAANQLAEAHAWLESARQAHGGGVSIGD